MNWALIIVILCATYQTIDAGSSSSGGSPPSPCGDLVALNLPDLSKTVLTFLNNALPAIMDAANDIDSKITEFKAMNGIQEFYAIPALYGQYIQLYSILSEQYTNQANSISSISTATPSAKNSKSTIIFCEGNLASLIASFRLFAQGCDASRQGVVDTVTSFVASVSSKGLTVNEDDSLEYQTKFAIPISNALNAINDGIQSSIYAADMAISVVNGTYEYQKYPNGAAMSFLQNWVNYQAIVQNRLNDIYTQNENANNAFFNANSAAFTMYTLSLPDYYSALNKAQKSMANDYKDIVTAGNTLTAQLAGAPSSSIA